VLKSLKNGWIIPALAATLLLTVPAAEAQRKRTARPAAKKSAPRSGAESGLIGIKLFDSGIRVVQVYGNPDQIQSVGGAGGSAPAGGGGGRGGFGGAGGGGTRGGAGAPSIGAAEVTLPPPPDPMDGLIGGNYVQGAGASPDDVGPGAGRGQGPGRPGPSGPSGPSGPGGAGGGGATTETANYTRWIYTKSGTKFGFVIDKFNRVIQIEAIGLQNGRVKTARGISFGSSFSQVIKAYAPTAAPDGYDITGDTVTVKFLTRQRVAFRLSKLGAKQAHVVTGIVVAAGKA